MKKTLKNFSIDLVEGSFSGPKEYMNEQGNAKLDQILAGKCETFNATTHLSPDLATAILVWMQTDYAGWLGTRQLERLCPVIGPNTT